MNAADEMPKEGLFFIGEKGKMLSGYYGGKNTLLPESKFRNYQAPPRTLPRTIGHYKEWTEACKKEPNTLQLRYREPHD